MIKNMATTNKKKVILRELEEYALPEQQTTRYVHAAKQWYASIESIREVYFGAVKEWIGQNRHLFEMDVKEPRLRIAGRYPGLHFPYARMDIYSPDMEGIMFCCLYDPRSQKMQMKVTLRSPNMDSH